MKADVFSTYVEVILRPLLQTPRMSSILHVCGGDPLGFDDSWAKKAVFSTYVEVIQYRIYSLLLCHGILHVCGGDPGNS